MKYFLTIGSRKHDFLRMKFGRIATVESKTAELLIAPAKGSTRPTIGEAVLITKELDGTVMTKWQGKVFQVQDIPLENDIIKIIAYDLKHKINFKNVLNAGYASVKGSTILSTELETPSITDLTAGTISTSDSALDTMSFGKSITGKDSKITKNSAFEIIQIVSDRDIYVKRDGTVDYGTSVGTDRSATHVLEHVLNCTLAPDIGYSEDETRRVKQVIVKGAGVGTNFILGTAGTPLSTENVKQLELPYIPSNATATSAAQTIFNELDKTNKYSKVILSPDVFKTNYDVFDTVKLKARLTNRTINENLKIFSIETIVSAGDEVHETVTLELQNFARAQLASMINPIEASSNTLASLQTGISLTQTNRNNLPSRIEEQISSSYESSVTSLTSITSSLATFGSVPIMGVYITLSMKITVRKKTAGEMNIFFFNATIGTFPDNTVGKQLKVNIPIEVGEVMRDSLTYFIPADLAGLTLQMFGEVVSTGEVEITGKAFIESVGF